MKKKGIILGIITAALAIGSMTFATIIHSNKKPEEVSAEAYNDKTSVLNGLYTKVTDVNSIANGEDLLLVGGGTHTLQHIVGASYHYWITTEYGGVTAAIGDIVYCNNAKGEMVTLDKADRTDDVFYMRLKHYVDNVNRVEGKVKSGYLVQEAVNDNGVTSWGDLYIREKKNKPSQAAATWKFSYRQNTGCMQVNSMLNNRPFFWKSGGNSYTWDSFACSTNVSLNSNVNFFRKVPDSQSATIEVTHMPNTVTYDYGDPIDLTGLAIKVTFADGTVVNSSYASDAARFKAINYSYAEQCLYFSWCGIQSSFTVTVKHNTRDWHRYLQSSSPKYTDLRGSYLLGFVHNRPSMNTQSSQAEDHTYALNLPYLGTDNAGKVTELWYHENPVCDGFAEPDPAYDGYFTNIRNNIVTIELESDNKFYIKMDSKYMGYGMYGYPSKENSTSDGSFHFDVSVDNNNHIYMDNGAYILVYDTRTTFSYDPKTYQYEFNSPDDPEIAVKHLERIVFVKTNHIRDYHIPVELYRLQLTDNLLQYREELDNFRKVFYNNTAQFRRSDVIQNNKIPSANWATIKSAYNSLSLDVKGYLGSLTYNHYHEDEGTFEDMIDRYDSILNMYSNDASFDDFMLRGLMGTRQSARSVTFSGTNCTIAGNNVATYANAYTATITPTGPYYTYPDFVNIYMGEELLDSSKYTYNSSTGAISINANVVVDDILIEVIAATATYTITYVITGADGSNFTVEEFGSGNKTLKTFASITLPEGFNVPTGRQFKCWSIDGVEYAEGATIDVVDDVTIVAVYESIYKEVKDIENASSTVPYLAYDYDIGENNTFTYSNVIIRFRGTVTKALWDALDGNNSNIVSFGAMIAAEEYLSGGDLTHLFNTADGTNVRVLRSSKPVPTLLEPSQYDFVTEDTYSWNLRKNVATADLATRFTAVIFVETRDYGVVFLSQATASAKSLAQDLIASPNYDETSYDGSLKYLANI